MTNTDIYISKEIPRFTKNYQSLVSKHLSNPTKYKKPPNFDETIKDLDQSLPTYEGLFRLRNGIINSPLCNCGNKILFKPTTSCYPDLCVICSKKKAKQSNSKAQGHSITISGKKYVSIDEAVLGLKISRDTVVKNIMNTTVPDWHYSVDHDNKCIKIITDIHTDFLNKTILEDFISRRVTIRQQMELYGVKAYTHMALVYSYHNLDTKFKQVESSVHEYLDNKEILSDLYAERTQGEIANQINCSESLVCKALKRHEIPTHEYAQSAIERTFIAYIQSISDYKVLPRYREIGVEIDIYIPELKLGIEFDGLRFHCNNGPDDTRSKQEEKHKLAYKNGITLLQFTDVGETKHKLDIVKSMIAHRLGTDTRIAARKCKVELIKSYEARTFFESTHISGFSNAGYHYGLKFENELVMVMSFGKSRFSKEADWELIRMSAKKHTTVVGGASKLLSHFRRDHTGSILSYASLRHGTGACYSTIGFERIRRTKSGYFYTDMKSIYSRHKFQKANIQSICKLYDPLKTEAENAYLNGYTRYRDSGNLVYLLK
jgi:hypothetical protein